MRLSPDPFPSLEGVVRLRQTSMPDSKGGVSTTKSSTLSVKFIAADIDVVLKKLWAFCHDDLSRS